ncbi:acid-sensing ion channel 3 isoform X1 [Excalfactoria chinensis]|uniref:acid-sensing ion channel 3 isoform X1 n=1 Tax=Excalfactoria chinensis TaxID=46218 RepID=UPI003B3B92A1
MGAVGMVESHAAFRGGCRAVRPADPLCAPAPRRPPRERTAVPSGGRGAASPSAAASASVPARSQRRRGLPSPPAEDAVSGATSGGSGAPTPAGGDPSRRRALRLRDPRVTPPSLPGGGRFRSLCGPPGSPSASRPGMKLRDGAAFPSLPSSPPGGGGAGGARHGSSRSSHPAPQAEGGGPGKRGGGAPRPRCGKAAGSAAATASRWPRTLRGRSGAGFGAGGGPSRGDGAGAGGSMRGGGEGAEPRSRLRAFASSSSLHGISHIFAYGAALRRALWGAFFLGALGLLLMVCAERVAYFLTYPHVTKLDEVAAHNLTFPAITICNLNEFRFSKITRNDMYHVGELLALLNERYEISNPQLAEPAVLAALRDKANFKNFKAKPFSMAEFYNRTGHDLADMLLQCSFRGAGCSARNFSVIFTRLGKCYTFNSGQPGTELLTTLQGGAGNGLELMLNIQQEEYLPVWGDTDETSYEAGVKVQIHSQQEPPFIDQLGFGVAPGFQTFVSCQQQRLVYLPPPWGDCKATPIESDFFTNYSLTACRLDCETRYLAENCNCRMVHMPGNANVCTPEQYKECADPALDFLVKKDSEYCACRTPCDTVRYGKELSMVKIPSKASARYLARKFNKTEQYIADNVLVLDIFFEALNYEMIEQKKAYEVAGLLGDIGGQMGLFIGASLLTILEIFDYLYEVFRDKLVGFYKDKKRMRRSSSTTLEHPAVPGSPAAALPPRTPVGPCAATRTVSPSPRTCYLVTRL